MTNYKVSTGETTHGENGEHHLVKGEQSAMRLWHREEPADTQDKQPHANDYETLGYVVSGRVELMVDGETYSLEAGDSYLVPRGKEHTYRVIETLTAVEVISPTQ